MILLSRNCCDTSVADGAGGGVGAVGGSEDPGECEEVPFPSQPVWFDGASLGPLPPVDNQYVPRL